MVGTPNGFIIKFRNKATGEFLLDKRSRDATTLDIRAGKFLIVTTTGRVTICKLVFSANSAEL